MDLKPIYINGLLKTRIIIELIYVMVTILVVAVVYITMSDAIASIFTLGLAICSSCPTDVFVSMQSIWENFPYLVIGVSIMYVVIRAVRRDPSSMPVGY